MCEFGWSLLVYVVYQNRFGFSDRLVVGTTRCLKILIILADFGFLCLRLDSARLPLRFSYFLAKYFVESLNKHHFVLSLLT